MANTTTTVRKPAKSVACPEHPAYEADNCPIHGTAAVIGRKTSAAAAATKKPTTAKVTPASVRPQNIGGPVTSVEHPAASPKVAPAKVEKKSAKAPTKATAKATTKAPAKAPAKRSTRKVEQPTHPGIKWAALIEEKGVTQAEAARQMGIAGMTINRIVHGRGIPTAKITILFAQYLGLDVRKVWAEVADYELTMALIDAK